MKRMTLPLTLSLILLSPAVFAGEDEDDFESMFNGEDLSGWEGKPGGWWVEDGALTAQSTPENPCLKHHYLVWTGGEPGDFILRFSYKLEGGNSGVQFRSERRPDYDTWGYQADMEAGDQWTGCIFQHDRQEVVMRGREAYIDTEGMRKEELFATPESLQEKIKQGGWNDYEIKAVGPRIELRINGVLMCAVEDHHAEYARDKGIIALQMHPGPPMKVQFKDLRIKVLD